MQQTLGELEVNTLIRENRVFIHQGNFAAAAKRNEDVLARAGRIPPGDAALYNLGLIYAHQDNQQGDINRAYDSFKRLEELFPTSRFIEEARIWIGLIEKLRDCKKRQLTALKQKNIEPVAGDSLLEEKKELIGDRGFEAAVTEYLELLADGSGNSVPDQILYRLGLLYAHYENPKKDYKMARQYMNRLVSEYPGSPLIDETRVWLGVFDVIEKIQQVDVEIDEKKKEFIQ